MPRTRADLLDAARRLVAEHGSHGVSTQMIAAEAGVNQALVYRYFGSKGRCSSRRSGNGSPRSASCSRTHLPRS
ncbi:helix-turn-helix transcriptional regulator [Nocardioides sp. zg-536]|uniref:Helix-turn-helix transcriptional regulator n=1 Tax=Nocardioides faecalis TaxID=2803858 RepID=A0A938Y7Q6_9ACTN|nr:helix-turn-helix transcriptional regulator [Nocardioides faecalis]MBS4752759.1 helix-turn-helix transcriptional regulator [Nocardioides faecalis]QVI58008.1 helix-turn-helix transcriptional regulator [Nocardioides faecalis]